MSHLLFTKFSFIQLSWWWRQSLPTSFHGSHYDRWTSRMPSIVSILESCAGRVDPRGLRVPAFAGRVREPALRCVRVRGGCGLYLLRVRDGRGLRNSLCG